jgi:pilus assembly protein CpaC
MLLSALLSIALAGPAEPAPAPAAGEASNVIEVSVGESVIRQEARPVARVLISDPQIVELRLLEQGQYQLRAMSAGKTDLWVWFRGDEEHPVSYQVMVSNSQIFEVRRRIESTGGGSVPRVYTVQDRLVVEGAVDDLETLERVAAVARIYDEKFVNLMTVRGDTQVQLRVVFAEVSRSNIREMGLNGLLDIGAGGGFWQSALSTPVVIAGDYGLGLAGAAGMFNFTAVLSVLEQNNIARTLAQPTLVALSGQQADFMVGGEIPVPVGQRDGVISVEYKDYGIKLSFVPTVLSGDVVDMRAKVEVSDVDPANGIQLVGIQLPALSVRKAESHLRLRSGMTFAMAGMLSERTIATRAQIPLLGDIPIIGSAFRYVKHEREEMELMVFVTPYLVRPMAADEVPPTPGTTESFAPSDFDLYMLGALTGGPGTRTSHPAGAIGMER